MYSSYNILSILLCYCPARDGRWYDVYFLRFALCSELVCPRFCRVGKRTLWSAKHWVNCVVGSTPGNRFAELCVSWFTKADSLYRERVTGYPGQRRN